MSVNKDAGFSIVSWDGNAVIPSTIGHGLDKAPEFRFQKNRETTDHWAVYHKSTLATHYLHLNSTAAAVDNVNRWYDTEPTSKVFTVTNDGEVNGAGQEMISYCWHSVEGFSKFGSYKGNSSADGPFVYLGFKPALVIVKISTGVERWYMWDNKRNPTNPVYKYQMADDAGAEGASYTGGILDFVSNGFKLREATSIYWNNSSHTYIYAAWAEIPFKYANAR